MHPHFIEDFDLVSKSALARLAREIPNAEAAFADNDPELPEFRRAAWFRLQAFSRADHVAARVASAAGTRRASIPWLLDFGPARPDAAEIDLSWATTVQQALAVAVETCRLGLVLPDKVAFDPRARRFTASARGRVVFSVYPLGPAPELIGALLKRAKGTLVGFRKSPQPAAELHKRIARWPGAGHLVLPERNRRWPNPTSHGHLPVPGEWLLTAKLLLLKAGLPCDTDLQQRFVAAFFGAKDFNTLVRGTAEEIAGLGGPWRVRHVDGAGKAASTVYPDPFSAFVGFMSTLQSTVESWGSAPQLWTDDWSPTGTLQLMVSHSSPQSVAEASASLSFGQVPYAEAQGDFVSAVGAALKDAMVGEMPSGTGMLDELFMLSLTPEERFAEHTAQASMRPFAEHGPWRFLESGEGIDRSKPGLDLEIVRVDTQGNVLVRESVPIYKGGVAFDEELGAMVFFTDYDHSHPVAAVPGLPARVVRQISERLNDRNASPRELSAGERAKMRAWQARLEERIAGASPQ